MLAVNLFNLLALPDIFPLDLGPGSSVLDPWSFTLFIFSILGIFILLTAIIISLVLNIIRRRKAEAEVQLSERKYRNVVDNANEGIAVIQNNNYIFFNQKMLDMTGYSSQKFSSLSVPQSIYPEDRSFVVSYYQNRLQGKPAPQSYECRFLNHQGEPLWVHINAVRIEWDKKPATLAFLTDITERKHTEKALQASEERYRTLVQNVPIGIYRNTPGPGGRFLMTNQFFRSLFGYNTKEEMKKIYVSDLYVYPEQRRQFSDNLLQKGSVSGVEILMKRKDGTQIWCSITARVVHVGDTQTVAYFDGTIEDISKRKKAEFQLRKLNEELENRVVERTNELQNTNQVLQRTLSRLEEEEEAGKAIQFQLLPQEKVIFSGFEFSRYLLPSTYLSGDFTDYFEIDERYLGFYIADVSGHGISSAFVTVLLKSFMNKYLEKYLQQEENTILHTEQVLHKLNQEIYEKQLEKYLTIFYAIIDKQENRLIYSNGAQFPFPIFFDTLKSTFITANNCPVGLFDFCTYTTSAFKLPEEFIVFAASDGFLHVLEQTELQEQQDYLLSLIKHKDISVVDLVRHFSLDSKKAFPDDITFLMLKRVS